jgi:hypothetical protein
MNGKAGIGKLALYGRVYLVAGQPRERGMVDVPPCGHAKGICAAWTTSRTPEQRAGEDQAR